jgi:acetolactate synthase, large subunit, biosynthetic type
LFERQENLMAMLKGAEIVVECLKEQGVDTVFGYPGGAILNIYDALYKNSDAIRHILTAHEQAASHAADGYARASGKVGVCLATSGPGATNIVTGIATAYMDSIPIVAITCNVAKNLLGKNSFQEIDICGVTKPITKANFQVKDGNELADTIRNAFEIARSGRPGPVLIDITKDVTGDSFEYEFKEISADTDKKIEVNEKDVDELIDLINKSDKPYILVGGGVISSGAAEEVTVLAHKINSPLASTIMARGAFSSYDELYTGMVGMHGTKTSNLGISECDLLIVIGARFSDRIIGNSSKFAVKSNIVHIDIDSSEIGKNVAVYKGIVGDAKEVLKKLNSKLTPKRHDEWIAHINKLKERHPLKYDENKLTGQYVIEVLDRISPEDTIVVTEVGQHQMWTSQFYNFSKPRTFLTSGGLGTMGYGLGAAMGAKVAFPERLVVNVAGDGCFRMNFNEIATAVRNNIPIVQLVINNHVLGMVRQWQDLYYEKRYSHTTLVDKVDFVKLAEAMGAKAYRITKLEEVVPVLTEAINQKEPVVIDCQIDSDIKVFPMVSPGAAISEVFDERDM